MSQAAPKSRPRRIALIVLIAVSVAALALAGLMRWFVPDRVVKTPLTVDTALILHGSGKILNANGELTDASFLGTQILQADSDASDDTNIVFNAYSCLLKDTAPTSDAANCQKITDNPSDPSLLALSDRNAVNRKTGASVNDAKYGTNIDGAFVQRSGESYRFPFDTQKKTYQYFDTFLKKTYPADYQDTATFGGLTVYRFVVTTPTVSAVISGSGADAVQGTYQDTKTLWVEPRTGTIVNASEHQVRKQSDGSPALDVTVGDMAPTDSEVVVGADGPRTVHTPLWWAKDGRDKIHMLTVVAPLVLLGLGIVTGIAAAWLLWPPRRRKTPVEPAPTPRTLAPVG